MRPLVVSALAASLVVVSPVAGAQDQGSQGQQQGQVDQGDNQGAPPAEAKATGSTGGYSYSDKPAARGRAGKKGRVKRHPGPIVSHPGFEQTEGGGSRLFVALSAPVQVEERKAQGSITYILKSANVRVRNNMNALETVHFNTPVSRARLVPRGNDLHFVVDLRAATTPTWKMTEGPEKSAVLQIEFPGGNFVAAEGDEETAPAPPAKKPAPAGEPPTKRAPAGPKP